MDSSDSLYSWVSDSIHFGPPSSLTPNSLQYAFMQVPGTSGTRTFLIGNGNLPTLFEWNGSQFLTGSSPFIHKNGHAIHNFQIGSNQYVAISIDKSGMTPGFTTIWQWVGNSSWSSIQTIPSGLSGITIKDFQDIYGNTYLLIVEFDVAQGPATSNLYKFQGTTFTPTPIQSFPSLTTLGAEIFTIDTTIYLILVTIQDPSRVYRWNNMLSIFDQISTVVSQELVSMSSISTTTVFGTRFFYAGYQVQTANLIGVNSIFQLF